MRLSVLIVNWNTRDDLVRCLASLREVDAEIIVVDNASTDGSAEMVRSCFPDVRLIQPGRNLGYAAGNNQAASAACGDYLLFLNPDTVVPNDAPERMARFLEQRTRAALVAPRLVSSDASSQASVRGFPTPFAFGAAALHLDCLFPRSRVLSAYRLPAFDYDETQPAPQPMASAWMVRRTAWDDVGPFDPRFPLFFNDVDWCLRAARRGWEVWYDADVRVEHRGGASTAQVKPKATWESHRALVAFTRKHYASRLGPIGLALYSAAVLATGAVRALLYSWKKPTSDPR